LDNTPRQIYLQRLLDLPTPIYAHVPTLTEADGRKLAKSARSVRLDGRTALPHLLYIFELLGLKPPAALASGSVGAAWDWGIARWDINDVAGRLTLPVGL
jgi:glutamyl-Q tRNA(Asp) synthetase